jgi:hypothetical protein
VLGKFYSTRSLQRENKGTVPNITYAHHKHEENVLFEGEKVPVRAACSLATTTNTRKEFVNKFFV